MKKLIIFLSIITIISSSHLLGFPYDMYSGMTGQMTLGLTGYLDTRNVGAKYKEVAFQSPIYLNYGITRNIDIFAGVLPISYTPEIGIGAGTYQFSIMPRFQFMEGLIGAAEILFPSSKGQNFGLNPQLHYLGGLGDFMSGFINIEVPMYFDNPLGIVEAVRLKGSLALYPGSFLGFSLLGIYIEYHISYDFYGEYVSYLDHLGLGLYLAFNNDATFGINLSPFVNQVGKNQFAFGFGAWIYYAYDFRKLLNK